MGTHGNSESHHGHGHHRRRRRHRGRRLLWVLACLAIFLTILWCIYDEFSLDFLW